MRACLGITIDNRVISTALADADTPFLGAIDEFGHRWGEDENSPSVAASARAVTSAAQAAIERAVRSHLRPPVVGVVCERSEVRERIPDALFNFGFESIELVDSLVARLAYLQTTDVFVGLSTILAVWQDGREAVVAAIEPATGTVRSAYRYVTDEMFTSGDACTATIDLVVAEQDRIPEMLVAMGTTKKSGELCAEAAKAAGWGYIFLEDHSHLAIGAALTAAALSTKGGGVVAAEMRDVGAALAQPRRWPPALLWPVLLSLTGLLIGLLFTFTPDTATTDRPPAYTAPTTHYSPGYPLLPPLQPHTERPGTLVETGTPPFTVVLPACEPATAITPALSHRSDPEDIPPSTAPPPLASHATDERAVD